MFVFVLAAPKPDNALDISVFALEEFTAVLPEAKIRNPEMVPFFQELELVIPKLKEINEQILELSR